MDKAFWQQKWQAKQTAFHIDQANPLLLKHIGQLHLTPQNRIFIPLCGKTLDIHWLLAQGYQVTGAELIEMAVEQLFDDLDITPTITEYANHRLYSAANIDIWVGDVFELTQQQIGPIQAVYDRAAFVALPPEIKQAYVNYIANISGFAQQLMISYAYDQDLMAGPPFSSSQHQVKHYYSPHYKNMQGLITEEIELKGQSAEETVWLMKV